MLLGRSAQTLLQSSSREPHQAERYKLFIASGLSIMRKVILGLTAVTISLAQQAPPPVQSPDVQSDGRVTFRFRDPNAQRVVVNVEGAKAPLVMQKDEGGVWT